MKRNPRQSQPVLMLLSGLNVYLLLLSCYLSLPIMCYTLISFTLEFIISGIFKLISQVLLLRIACTGLWPSLLAPVMQRIVIN